MSSFSLKLIFGLFISTTLRPSYTEFPSSERSINSRPSCILYLSFIHPRIHPKQRWYLCSNVWQRSWAYHQYLYPAYGIFRHAVDTPSSGSTASNPHSWHTFLDLVTSPTSCTWTTIWRDFLSSCRLVKISLSVFFFDSCVLCAFSLSHATLLANLSVTQHMSEPFFLPLRDRRSCVIPGDLSTLICTSQENRRLCNELVFLRSCRPRPELLLRTFTPLASLQTT